MHLGSCQGLKTVKKCDVKKGDLVKLKQEWWASDDLGVIFVECRHALVTETHQHLSRQGHVTLKVLCHGRLLHRNVRIDKLDDLLTVVSRFEDAEES